MLCLRFQILSLQVFTAFVLACLSSTAMAESPETGANNFEFKLVGMAVIAGDQLDQSSLTGELADGTPNRLFGGISGLEYTGYGNSFLALSDRGPQDGAVDWHCRFHRINIPIPIDDSTTGAELKGDVRQTIVLQDEKQRHFTGLAKVFEGNETTFGRFDPEGIRLRANGNILISDEYGPHLIEFSQAGKQVKSHPIPSSLQVENPGINKATENAANKIGRACNRGMEGISLSPNGQFAFGVMQSALLQDATLNESGKPVGLHCRIIKMDLNSGQRSEFVYVMDDPGFKLHEILYGGNDEFYVLENCGEIAEAATCKKVTKISLKGATDVKDIASLPHDILPASIIPVSKSTVIDLLDPVHKIELKDIPEKIEGLTFGPDIEGSQTLVIASDNDFVTAEPTRFFVFRRKVTKP